MKPEDWIEKLLGYAVEKLGLDPRDRRYARNTVLMILNADSFGGSIAEYEGETIGALLEGLNACALALGLYGEEESENKKDAVAAALMLPPSAVEERFSRLYARSPAAATDWLYEYAVRSDYVKKEKLDQNPRFRAKNGLIVTINRTKPEFRDPKKAVSGNSVKGGYPKCSICRENEGYFPRGKRTLRTVTVPLGDGRWFWQFSPYGYFRQHGIAVNERHIPMKTDEETFGLLMDFVDAFPHYFIGCNAPLPRIGGSVLAHDHFQGGGEDLPLFAAKPALTLHAHGFSARVDVLDWFGTCVRVSGCRRDVSALSEKIRKGWEGYEDRARGLIPFDGEPHHAVSPTVRKRGEEYEMNLILRSNITSEEFPDGVFHAHPEFHIIKKESIGLIEAQGLFILPGRLVPALDELKTALLQGELPPSLGEYRLLYTEIAARGLPKTPAEAQEKIEEELGDICARILGNTAVFDTARETAEFLQGLGFYD